MNLSHAYGAPPPPEAAEQLLRRALELGVTMFDTAALYGFGANETLVGRVLKAHRDHFVLASKGGMAGVTFDDGVKRVIDGVFHLLGVGALFTGGQGKERCGDQKQRVRFHG